MRVIVEKIFDNKANGEPYKDGFKGMQLRGPEQKVANITTDLLGGEPFTKPGRVAFATVSEAKIAELGIKEGSDLGVALQRQICIAVTELIDSAYQSLEAKKQIGFTQKRPNKEGEFLTSNGEAIWRKSYLAEAGTKDVLVQHDNVLSSVPEAAEKQEA